MGMNASNRSLPDWFYKIRTGQIALPRFQRYESWSHPEISTLLDSVLRGRPVGAALVLEIGDREPFVSRRISGLPPAIERVSEHLLDGQQRLTALWKALGDGYTNRTYFASLDADVHDGSHAIGVGRWEKNGRVYPLWADQPEEQFARTMVPMKLLNPQTDQAEIYAWCDAATPSVSQSRIVERKITDLRTAVREANIPFLSLPVGTPADEAIDVFIKMNTSSVRLTAYDIVVAQLEAATGQSLHDRISSLRTSVPEAERYVHIPDLVLRVVALLEDRSPTEASFMRLDLKRLPLRWEAIERGINGAISFLAEENIVDRDRLPTVAVLPVLAAIWSQMPRVLDAHGQARTVLQRYLWRSFFTERYDRAAATAALQDFRGLKAHLGNQEPESKIPVLDERRYPIAATEQLERAPWPRVRNTLSRAILAASLRAGGIDFADGTPANIHSVPAREYHHLFPTALLKQEGHIDDSEINLAVNCALVTWNTNRRIAAKEPIAYLRERVQRAPLGANQIAARLRSHLIPFNELNVGNYHRFANPNRRAQQIKDDYRRFVRARAEHVYQVVHKLCSGEAIQFDSSNF